MKNIFGGSLGAYQLVNGNRYRHEHRSVTTVADATIAEVNSYFLNLSHQYFPESQGWYGHYGDAAIVSESQIKDFLESRQQQ